MMIQNIIDEFVSAINSRHIEKIYSMLADDTTMVDAHGNELKGYKIIVNAWKTYFEWFPDYHITISEIFIKGDSVVGLGFASGSYLGDKETKQWRLPAAWKVIVASDKISLWQVFADTKIPSDIIANHNKAKRTND